LLKTGNSPKVILEAISSGIPEEQRFVHAVVLSISKISATEQVGHQQMVILFFIEQFSPSELFDKVAALSIEQFQAFATSVF
jgi:hypothetical protein